MNLLLFADRKSVENALGFNPFELFFGHSAHGPLKLLKENWLSENAGNLNLLDYVSSFRSKLKKAFELAQHNVKENLFKNETAF